MLCSHRARYLWLSPPSRRFAQAATEYLLKTNSSHYQVLDLPPNASSPDIRAAFVKISKQVHPDKNPDDPHTHTKFVRLNEAYTVLSNVRRRRDYDQHLLMMRLSQQNVVNNVYSTHTSGESYTYTPGASGERFYWDERTWSHRRDTRNTDQAPETDFFRSSNGRAVLDCFLIMLAGVGLFFYGLRASKKEANRYLQRSNENLAIIHKMRNDARVNGPQKRFEVFQDLLRRQHAEAKARQEASLIGATVKAGSASTVSQTVGPASVRTSRKTSGSEPQPAGSTSTGHQTAGSTSTGHQSASTANEKEEFSYL